MKNNNINMIEIMGRLTMKKKYNIVNIDPIRRINAN